MFKNRLGHNRFLVGAVFTLGSLIFGYVPPAIAAEKRQRGFSDERPSAEKRMCLQLSEIDNSMIDYLLQLPLDDIQEEPSPWSDSLEYQSEALHPKIALLVDAFNEEFPSSMFPDFDSCLEPKPLFCNSEATQSVEFRCDEIIYTGERPFACTYEGCDYRASRAGNLRAHERTHTGEKRFACTYEGCGYRASRAWHLREHERTHTGEKPFVCTYEGCGYRAAQNGNLRAHERTHTGEKRFACTYEGCGFRTSIARDLRRHEKKHTREKPFIDPDAATFPPHQQALN